MYSNHKKLLSVVFVEFLLWLLPAVLFLILYVYKYHANIEACVLHLIFVSELFFLVTCLRCLAYRWMEGGFAQFFGAGVFSITFLLLIVYYVSALIGLDGWGRLISWALIVTYAGQANYLVESLGFNAYVLTVALLLLFLGISFALHAKVLSKDGVVQAVRKMSTPMFYIAFMLFFLAIAISFWRFFEFPMADRGEPFSLTMHPAMVSAKFQNHHKLSSPRLDAEENAARQAYEPVVLDEPANVILIVVDALRADHLRANGYERSNAPYIEQLMRSGKWKSFNNTYSVCAESACGLMGLSSSRNLHMFVNNPITIQEVLRKHGYSINMILGGDHTNFYGLREAYGHVDTYFDASMSGNHYINDDSAIVDRLKSFPSYDGRSTYIQFHMMSVHGLGARENNMAPFHPSVNYYADAANRVFGGGNSIEEYVNFYDNGVYVVDKKIESIMNILESKGYLNNAIVVLTADHGEYLGEKGRYGHAKGVGRAVLHIPLLIGKYNASSWSEMQEDSIASIVDIAPTVLSELGVPIPLTWQGRALQKKKNEIEHAYFQQVHEYGLVQRGEGSVWKFSVNSRTGREYVYDVSVDPAELFDISDKISQNEKNQWRRQLIDVEVNARQALGGDI